jgi:hypothetical protein
MKNLVILCLLGLMFFGCVQEKEIPKAVLDKYENLSDEYEAVPDGPIGAFVFICTKDGKEIYHVKGTDGMEEITYYYDSDGNYIDKYFRGEMSLEKTQPPIDTSDYDCKTLKSSQS